jgi:hypothetical protein
MSYQNDYAEDRAAGCGYGDDDDLFGFAHSALGYGMGAAHSAAHYGMGLTHSAAALGMGAIQAGVDVAHNGINEGLGLAEWSGSVCANTISPPAPMGQCGCGGPLPCGCGLLPLVPKMPLKRIFSIFMALLMIVVLAFLITIVVLIVQKCGKKKKKSRCCC